MHDLQVAGMKLEEEAAPQPKRNSAPLMAKRTGPVPGHLAAPLRNSAPASRVSMHDLLMQSDARAHALGHMRIFNVDSAERHVCLNLQYQAYMIPPE